LQIPGQTGLDCALLSLVFFFFFFFSLRLYLMQRCAEM
jgi:hypothetical protein